MTNVDPVFAGLMVKLAEAWGTKLTEARIRLYATALADIPLPQLKQACSRAVKESQFFPTIAFLRQCVDTSVEDRAILAWALARKAAAEAGGYATVTFDDGALAVALASVFGSWATFCAQEEGPELHTRRQEFLAAYRVARVKTLVGSALPGLCELSGHYKPELSLAAHVGADGTVTVAPSTALVKRGAK